MSSEVKSKILLFGTGKHQRLSSCKHGLRSKDEEPEELWSQSSEVGVLEPAGVPSSL